MMSVRIFIVVAAALATLHVTPSHAQSNQYAVLIGGLGGTPEYTSKFEQYLFDTREALINDYGFGPENIRVLAETSLASKAFVDDASTSDNIRAVFTELTSALEVTDTIVVVLFGHGNYAGDKAMLNIPRRDLSDLDYAALLGNLPTSNVVFINTASASGPFIQSVSAERRIVVTATKSGGQTNETSFPQYLVEGLSGRVADLDRDGNVSIAELFRFAGENTAREYTLANKLATEHALLEDTGDGRGFEYDMLDANGEGVLAAVTFLGSAASSAGAIASSGSDTRGRQAELLLEIAELKRGKSSLSVDDYYEQLEVLFVELARLVDRSEEG